eukprot:TRINITY_DN12744_c0_g1_i1.p1 TRINITY_DN12744_c0_g1~~TRINITY_DN12744_c0_g1_i1.p1  ORF type:complete len:315 (-),score=73.95 TRINITY_DN12744_c0_g1_i1:313-1257(-)
MSRIQLLLGAVAVLVLLQGLVDATTADEGSHKIAHKIKHRRSARAHHNAEFTLNHTHTRSRFKPGSLHHFEHVERVGSAHAHMFNLFRLAGDFLHLGAFGFLLFHLHTTKSCEGVSFKTQALYLAVFLCRYIDIFWNFISMYNSVMKLLFIGTTGYILYMMHTELKSKQTPETEANKALLWIIPGCALLAVVLNDHTTECGRHPFDCMVSFLWAFSIYLEAVAIIPQLMLLKRKKIVKNLTGNYIFCLGAYRALYLINWFYRYFVDPISAPEFFIKVCAGLVQTGIFFNFFVVYANSKRNNIASDVIMAPDNLD